MDLYILNRELETIAVIDTYTSLIWTDRYYEAGDFELCLPLKPDVFNYLCRDYYIWRNDSEHVMIIESLSIKMDAESGNKLTVSGRSLESILDRRIVWGLKNLSGSLEVGIEELLNECIITPSKPERKIDNFIFEFSNDPYISSLLIDTQYTGTNLYEIISGICSEHGIGFKVVLNSDNEFVFKLYNGVDRSYDQLINPHVVFSPNFDNILNSSYLESCSSWNIVALIGGEGEGEKRRYTAVGNTSGLDRREIFTDARDISSDTGWELTEEFNFAQYPSQAFDNNTKTFVTDSNFNSSMIDVSKYVGRKISVTIPKCKNAYATILVNASKRYISTLKAWEVDSTSDSGRLETYEFDLPADAQYLYTSMYSETAVNNGLYSGKNDDFECKTVQLSNDEYVALLRQRGKDDLTENMEIVSFEGEADTTTMFVYGKDFFTGDIVQIADEYGHEAKARVLELVRSENEDGSSTSYPTFSTYNIQPTEVVILPEGYTKISYIESDGNQYIDLGFKANQNTRIVLDAYFLSQTEYPVAVFGARNSDSSPSLSFAVWVLDVLRFRTDYGNLKSNVFVEPPGRHVIDKHKGTTYVDEVLVMQTPEIFETPYNIVLFSQRDVNGVDSRRVRMRLYSCKMYDDGVLSHNYIPCINDNQDVGLYDVITGMFLANSGTGVFIAGTEGV